MLLSYETRERIREFFETVPTWATLRTLGQSKFIAATALVPFLGYLLLFNAQLMDLLVVSPRIVGQLFGMSEQVSQEASRGFTITRLQYTYFGLTFIGVASSLFALLCPNEIKKYAGITDYIDGEQRLITEARRGTLVRAVISNYLLNHGEEERRGPSYLRRVAYPRPQEIDFDSVVVLITQHINADEDTVDSNLNKEANGGSGVQADIDPDPYKIFVGPRSEIDSERVARIIYNARAIDRGFWLNFNFSSKDYLEDLLALRYGDLVHSRPSFRIMISFLYLIGFSILLVPTFETFLLVARRVFNL